MSDLTQWLANIAGVSIVASFLGWVLKRYLDQRLTYFFKEKEQQLSYLLKEKEQRFGAELRVLEKYGDHVRDVMLREFPLINELVYQSKNLFRDAPGVPDAFYLDELQHLWNQLAEKLYRYQLYLPQTSFDLLHTYKRQFQTAILYLSARFEEDSPLEGRGVESGAQITSDDSRIRTEILTQLEGTQREILRTFREHVESKTGAL